MVAHFSEDVKHTVNVKHAVYMKYKMISNSRSRPKRSHFPRYFWS